MNAPLIPNEVKPPSLEDMAEAIQTREDFARFVRRLSDELAAGGCDWENDTLPNYLDALAAFSESIEGYFLHRKQAMPVQPSWKLMAEILLAARVYE